MATFWFLLVALMLVGYVVFDGFDLGVGAIYKWVAKTPEERGLVRRSIGPVWDANEVWLLAAGGTLYFAFPALYAASFSGFYLPLMMVLWLLIGRALAPRVRINAAAVYSPLTSVRIEKSRERSAMMVCPRSDRMKSTHSLAALGCGAFFRMNMLCGSSTTPSSGSMNFSLAPF